MSRRELPAAIGLTLLSRYPGAVFEEGAGYVIFPGVATSNLRRAGELRRRRVPPGTAWIVGIASVLSFNLLADFRPLGFLPGFEQKTWFDTDPVASLGSHETSDHIGQRQGENARSATPASRLSPREPWCMLVQNGVFSNHGRDR
jgi:hypothetical protein